MFKHKMQVTIFEACIRDFHTKQLAGEAKPSRQSNMLYVSKVKTNMNFLRYVRWIIRYNIKFIMALYDVNLKKNI